MYKSIKRGSLEHVSDLAVKQLNYFLSEETTDVFQLAWRHFHIRTRRFRLTR